MSAYAGLPKAIALAASRLDDAISTEERTNGCGYTLLLIPVDPSIPVLISLDGKPVPVEPGVAFVAALSLREGVAGR